MVQQREHELSTDRRRAIQVVGVEQGSRHLAGKRPADPDLPAEDS